MLIPDAIRRRLDDTGTRMILGGGALLVLVGLLVSVLVKNAEKTYGADFVVLYVSGIQFFDGNDVYASLPFNFLGPVPDTVESPDRDMHANLNPPFTVLLLAPLSRLPYPYAYLTWSLVLFACAVAGAWLAAGAYAGERRRALWSLGILLLLLVHPPTWVAFLHGQTALPVFLLLAAGWRLMRDRHEPGAGVLLGATLAIKPFAGLLLVWFLATRRWRLLAWYAGGFTAANLVALLFMGPDVFLRYLEILRTVTWHGMETNASLFGLLARLPGGAEGPDMRQTAQGALILGYAASLVLFGALVLLSRRLPAWPARQGIDIGYAACLVLMLLISPLGWVYYFPILLISILVVFRESQTRPRAWPYRYAAGAAWLISGALYFFVPVEPGAAIPHTPFHVADLYTGTLLLLAGALAALGRSAGRNP